LTLAAAALAVSPLSAQDEEAPAPRPMALERPLAVSDVKRRIVEVVEDSERAELFGRLSKTAPRTGLDVTALFDLFQRFPSEEPRRAVLESLSLLKPSPDLEPLFVAYLKQPDPEAQFFGVSGAYRLRSAAALPLVRKIAERKFKAARAEDSTGIEERNAWWTQYEALETLALWEGAKALPLLERRAQESPEVARILGRRFWRHTMPKLKAWARSSKAEDRMRARRASAAPIELEDARATRADMLTLLKDKETDEEVRHRLALKLGMSSEEAEAAELVKEHDAASSERDRLLWAAAAFASKRQAAVPLIAKYAREGEDETTRKGARQQLEDMLGAEAAKKLLDDGIKK